MNLKKMEEVNVFEAGKIYLFLNFQMLPDKGQGLVQGQCHVPVHFRDRGVSPHGPAVLHFRELPDLDLLSEQLLGESAFLGVVVVVSGREEQLRTPDALETRLLSNFTSLRPIWQSILTGLVPGDTVLSAN